MILLPKTGFHVSGSCRTRHDCADWPPLQEAPWQGRLDSRVTEVPAIRQEACPARVHQKLRCATAHPGRHRIVSGII